jgi:hypothetical protein
LGSALIGTKIVDATGEGDEHERADDRILFAEITLEAVCVTRMPNVRIVVGEGIGPIEDVGEVVAGKAICVPQRPLSFATSRSGRAIRMATDPQISYRGACPPMDHTTLEPSAT